MEHEYDTCIRCERKLLHTSILLIQPTWKPSNRVQPKAYYLGWFGTWFSHKDHDLVYMTAFGMDRLQLCKRVKFLCWMDEDISHQPLMTPSLNISSCNGVKMVGQHLFLNKIPKNCTSEIGWKVWCDQGIRGTLVCDNSLLVATTRSSPLTWGMHMQLSPQKMVDFWIWVLLIFVFTILFYVSHLDFSYYFILLHVHI